MTIDELETIYGLPLFGLLDRSRAVFARHWRTDEVQLCTLLSIKTGGCSEDCSYCAQSARHDAGVEPQRLLAAAEVLAEARAAKANGSARFCMGAAWRGIRDGDRRFEEVLDIVRAVADLGLEVCVTLGEVTAVEARRLREAGVTAYNHNIDTSPEFYAQIVSTHSFADRLRTIRAVQEAGLALCCGGIIGMGESVADRLRMLQVLCEFSPPPESVPINCLVPIPGTPLADLPPVDPFDLVRLIATARLALPTANIRLSAGRGGLSREAQALCLYAGANSIFYGERLLTTDNAGAAADRQLLADLALSARRPYWGAGCREEVVAAGGGGGGVS